jgi:hypothetical protein
MGVPVLSTPILALGITKDCENILQIHPTTQISRFEAIQLTLNAPIEVFRPKIDQIILGPVTNSAQPSTFSIAPITTIPFFFSGNFVLSLICGGQENITSVPVQVSTNFSKQYLFGCLTPKPIAGNSLNFQWFFPLFEGS